MAAWRGRDDGVKYLVENGAQVNATDKVRIMCAISQIYRLQHFAKHLTEEIYQNFSCRKYFHAATLF